MPSFSRSLVTPAPWRRGGGGAWRTSGALCGMASLFQGVAFGSVHNSPAVPCPAMASHFAPAAVKASMYACYDLGCVRERAARPSD